MRGIIVEKTYIEMREYRCPRWDELPDIALYMDQVLTVLDKHLAIFGKAGGDSTTTSTMINNYVKQNVVLSPEKKKYKREQLAKLLIIGIVKRVLSISEIDGLISMLEKRHALKDVYNLFCENFENALRVTFEGKVKDAAITAGDDTHIALVSACLAVANKLLVTELICRYKAAKAEEILKQQKKKPPEKDRVDEKEQQ